MKLKIIKLIHAKALIGAAALALAASLLSGCASSAVKAGYYASLSVGNPDLASVSDGSYTGSHALEPPRGVYVANPRVEVEVRVADHRYAEIAILTKTVAGWPHLAKLRGLILERQTLQVDAVSGATSLTGKAYLFAIEDALSKKR